MRLKLFWKLGFGYFLLLVVALAVVYAYTTQALERHFLETTFAQLDSLVQIAEKRPPKMSDVEDLRLWTDWMAESGARVTVISRDGQVLAESDASPELMDNHGTRPEIKEAFEGGRGQATRFSDTVKRDLVYLAVRYNWGASPPIVLRFAQPQFRITQAIAEVRRPVASVSLFVLAMGGVFSLFFSNVFAERVRRLRAFSKRISEGDFRAEVVPNEGDELDELAVALNETGERLESTIALLKTEQNLNRAILSAMSEGVAVIDLDERMLFANTAFLEMVCLNFDGNRVKGRRLSEITEEREIGEMARKVITHNKRLECEISLRQAEVRNLLVQVAPVTAKGVLIVLLDITDIRRLEHVRRDFVANVSHELRTPLTAVQGFAETLLEGAIDEPENSRRFTKIIRDHAARLGHLTADLLKLSQIEAGKVELVPGPVVVREVMRHCLDAAQVKAHAKEQMISIDLEDDTLRVKADRHSLAEVLQNLVDNAVQYSPNGRRIVLSGKTIEGEVFIEVTDDGIGIAKESHGRIFERFYRVDAARSREVGGTGLGLAITKHLVESMRGRVEVRSQLGHGSTFSVVLPEYRDSEN